MKQNELFFNLLLSIKYGEYHEFKETSYVQYQDNLYKITFCYKPKPRNIHINVIGMENKQKDNFFKRAENRILAMINPIETWAEVDITKHNGAKETAQIKGNKQLILQHCLRERMKHISR